MSAGELPVVCFSLARWEGGYVRVQQLMSRFARRQRVYFVEKPTFGEVKDPRLHVAQADPGVTVLVPQMPHGFDAETSGLAESLLLARAWRRFGVEEPVVWYTAPQADGLGTLNPAAVVYDCTSASDGDGSPAEASLLDRADLVFAAGHSLWRAKRALHPRTHLFRSPIDHDHFAQARRQNQADALPQAHLPRPRVGYLGRIDARFDLELLAFLSRRHSEWTFVLAGAVIDLAAERLPQAKNIHYLGPQPYDLLPALLASWDVALVPFRPGPATRFIHPAKIGAYFAAGCPVVSTPVPDIVEAYGGTNGLRIAATPRAFAEQVKATLADVSGARVHPRLNRFQTWNETWAAMDQLIAEVVESRRRRGRGRGTGRPPADARPRARAWPTGGHTCIP